MDPGRGRHRHGRHLRPCAGALGDIVFAEVPEAGPQLNKGDEAAVVELVKAASRRLCAGRAAK